MRAVVLLLLVLGVWAATACLICKRAEQMVDEGCRAALADGGIDDLDEEMKHRVNAICHKGTDALDFCDQGLCDEANEAVITITEHFEIVTQRMRLIKF